jgi:hypothetical protein
MRLRVYADTSVFGGCFVASDVTLRELDPAPPFVFSLLDTVPAEQVERVVSTDESMRLQAAYLAAKVVWAGVRERCGPHRGSHHCIGGHYRQLEFQTNRPVREDHEVRRHQHHPWLSKSTDLLSV